MQDVKNGFKFIKEKWKNPKFKGVIQIAFWLIFFILVSLLFRTNKSSIDNVKEEKEVNSYEYNYQYNDNNNIINISGTYYKDKEVFYINNNKYYFVNNNYYQAIDNKIINIDYSLVEWRYASIKNIMDKNNYSNKLEYEDGSIKYEYIIDYMTYNSYYNTNYTNNIILNIIVNEEKIKSVNINYLNETVSITYENINNIKDLDININVD